MRICSVMDCLYVDRAIYLCTEPSIKVNNRRECITYKVDKKYLEQVWHISTHNSLQAKGFVPETQEMVDMALSLSHTPNRKAGEEGN